MAKYAGKSTTSYSSLLSQNYNQMPSSSRAFDLGVGNYGGDGNDLLRSSLPPILADADKPIIVEVAVAAMEELVRLARAGHPLWVLSNNHNAEILNEEEYLRVFPRGTGSKPFGVRSESSRDSAIIMMNPANLVDMLMNVVSVNVLKNFYVLLL